MIHVGNSIFHIFSKVIWNFKKTHKVFMLIFDLWKIELKKCEKK